MTHSDVDLRQGTAVLRDVQESDLPFFFEHQREPEATDMAAFPSRDEEAFRAHWKKILGDDTVIKNTILSWGDVAGNVVCFEQSGVHLIGYWVGKAFWGKGLATRALSEFLTQVKTRPLQAYVAKHNTGSIRVLEKCGFVRSGESQASDGPDGEPVEEFIYILSK